MRTADTIAQQCELQDSLNAGKRNKKGNRRGTHPNTLKSLKATQFQPGVSGNPGGQPGFDVAASLCRAAIEQNQEVIYKGLVRALAKGNAYTLQVASDRGYGKLKETKEIIRKYQNASADDLNKRVTELLRDLGIAAQIDRANGDARGVEVSADAHEAENVLPGNGPVKA